MKLLDRNIEHFRTLYRNIAIVFDDINTEVGYFIGLGSHVTSENINFMIKHGRGLVYVCITEARAKELKLPSMTEVHTSENNMSFTVSVDHKTSTTGISAFERATTIKAFVNPMSSSNDFIRPGHVFPLISKGNGLLDTKGIAEAALVLAGLSMDEPVAFICEILNDAGEVSTKKEIQQLSNVHGMKLINLSEVVDIQLENTCWLEVQKIEEMKLGKQNLSVYQIKNILYQTHFSIYLRKNTSESNRVVFHEECHWGELFEMREKCSCQKHLKEYMSELLDGQIDCLVYERPFDSEFVTLDKRHAVKGQLKDFISKEMKATRHKEKEYAVNY